MQTDPEYILTRLHGYAIKTIKWKLCTSENSKINFSGKLLHKNGKILKMDYTQNLRKGLIKALGQTKDFQNVFMEWDHEMPEKFSRKFFSKKIFDYFSSWIMHDINKKKLKYSWNHKTVYKIKSQ